MQEVRELTDEVGELQLQRVCNVGNEWRGFEGKYKSTLLFEFRLKCARTAVGGTDASSSKVVLVRRMRGLVRL
jgi:hypothetical protein